MSIQSGHLYTQIYMWNLKAERKNMIHNQEDKKYSE